MAKLEAGGGVRHGCWTVRASLLESGQDVAVLAGTGVAWPPFVHFYCFFSVLIFYYFKSFNILFY